MTANSIASTTRELRWLYVDFNSYFASVEQQLNPALRGKPIAVIPVESEHTSAIAASYEAKAFGIKTGTPVWEARERCKDLICVMANHEHYVAFHQRILEEISRHIPVTEVCSIDEVACRLMKNETSIERITEISAAIKQGLRENIGEYVKCSIGVAPNKYLAKIATDMQKPDGFTVIEASDLPKKLHSLSLRDLPGVGHNNERRLWKAGIYDMETLTSLSPKQMRLVWGSSWGEKIAYWLQGIEIAEAPTNRSTVGHSHVMAPELREPDKARLVARRLTMKAASRLRRLGYHASMFHFSARLESGLRIEHSEQCYRAQDSLTFLELLDHAWEALAPYMKGQRLKKVSMSLNDLTLVDEKQQTLFMALPDEEIQGRERSEKMSRALDKINSRFGRDSVSIGLLPQQARGFSGTKIAFTRIPDMEEFSE